MVAAGAAFYDSKAARQRIVTSALWTGRTIPSLDCFGARPPSHGHAWVLSVCKAGACTCLCLASGLGPRLSLRLFPLMAAPQAPRAVGCDSGMPPRPTACRQASKSGVPCHAGPCEGCQSPSAREGQGPQGDPDLDHGDRSRSGMGYCTLCACVDEQKRKL